MLHDFGSVKGLFILFIWDQACRHVFPEEISKSPDVRFDNFEFGEYDHAVLAGVSSKAKRIICSSQYAITVKVQLGIDSGVYCG